jgi:hypothetical protein
LEPLNKFLLLTYTGDEPSDWITADRALQRALLKGAAITMVFIP